MKKHLIAAAVAAAVAVPAMAQVTIYGVLDTGYRDLETTATRTSGVAAGVGGATQAPAAITQAFEDSRATAGHASALQSSRIGFRGTEDLGGGLKAGFQVESTLTPGETTGGSFGSRPTFISLSGGFGEIRVGVQDTPIQGLMRFNTGGANNMPGSAVYSSFTVPAALIVAAADAVDAAATGGGVIRGLVQTQFNRMHETTVSRAINYFSPVVNGFQIQAQVASDDDQRIELGANLAATTKTTDQGVSAIYAAGPLAIGIAQHGRKTSGGAAAGTTTLDRKSVNFGASYNFGMATAFFQHATDKDEGVATASSRFDNSVSEIGVRLPMGALQLHATYGTGDRKVNVPTDRLAADLDPITFDQTSMQIGARYVLSKRTDVYAIYGTQKLEGSDNQAATDNATNLDSATLKNTGYAIGIRHSF